MIKLLPNRQHSEVVVFIDNEATLAALISGRSDNALVAKLINELSRWEEAHDVALWFERVASPSNPSDAPSRGDMTNLTVASRVRVEALQFALGREG